MIATLASDIHSAGRKHANDIATPPAKGIPDFCRMP